MPNGEEVPRPCSFLPYLFADIVVRTPQQLHEERHSAGIHHSLGLVRSAAGNVGQGPGRLELKHCVVGVAKELNQPAEEQVCIIGFLFRFKLRQGGEPGQDAEVDHHIDRWVSLSAQDLPC